MATIIVGHSGLDFDCIASMLAMRVVLRGLLGFKGEILPELVPPGKTFRGMKVDPTKQRETVGIDQIYHVDTGLGALDHHRPGCNAPSALAIIDQTFGLSHQLPEWRQIVEWVNEADQGRAGGCTVAALIRGEYRRLAPGPDRDWEIFDFVERMVEDLLANGRIRAEGSATKICKVADLLEPPLPECDVLVRYQTIEGFGNIGLIIGPSELGSTLRTRLETEFGCRIVISFSKDDGKTAVMACFPQNGETVDLRSLGIVQTIREVEAEARNLHLSAGELAATGNVQGMAWFAHEVEGNRIANLLCGSLKFDLMPEQRTRLIVDQVVNIVRDCIKRSLEKPATA